jgi:hypothetical protein
MVIDEKRSASALAGEQAENLVVGLMRDAGWRVLPSLPGSSHRFIARGDVLYCLQVKSAPEGRSDRLVPLWSQAILEAMRAAGDHARPLAVVAAPRVPPRVAEQVLEFAAEFAPDAAAGVIDGGGHRIFAGEFLDELNREYSPEPAGSAAAAPVANLFSDASQWLLKVLLAPELSEAMLAAPRGRYRNASQLARAAGVSVMSASRFVRQLRAEGFLHESAPHLALVRREELFRRWRSWADRPAREVGFRFFLKGPGAVAEAVERLDGCLGLFAAADALGIGFVQGVPPHVYVRRLEQGVVRDSMNLAPSSPGEAPDLILREAPAAVSVFKGAVKKDAGPVSDIVQVWLDVAAHPARGAEQAAIIREQILDRVIEGG